MNEQPPKPNNQDDLNDLEDLEPVPLEMNGELDLHTFAPRDVKELVPVWLEECNELGLRDLRIIHGKGVGVLREIVHSILKRHPLVEHYGHASDAGSWGATLVKLVGQEE